MATGYNLVQPIVPFKQVVEPTKPEKFDYETDDLTAHSSGTYNLGAVDMHQLCKVTLTGIYNGSVWESKKDPLISISGKNTIVKRHVAKATYIGSIKEFWSRDDFEITISGVIYDDNNSYQEIKDLIEVCGKNAYVQVSCEFINAMQIHYLSIESFDLPFTPGEGNYQYTIKAVSDDNYQVLEKE